MAGRIGAPEGIGFVEAGALGAMLGVGDEALLTLLGSFAVYLGARGKADLPPIDAANEAVLFLADYRRYLKEQGVANA